MKYLDKVEDIKSIDPNELSKFNVLEREKIINSSEITKFLHDKFPNGRKTHLELMEY